MLMTGLAGCGARSQGVAQSPPSPASRSSSVGSPTPSRSASPSATASTATGVVLQGAEPSCLVLRTAHGELLLQGEPAAALHAGQRVTVRGHVIHGILTHCMQGTPFEVTHVSTPPP